MEFYNYTLEYLYFGRKSFNHALLKFPWINLHSLLEWNHIEIASNIADNLIISLVLKNYFLRKWSQKDSTCEIFGIKYLYIYILKMKWRNFPFNRISSELTRYRNTWGISSTKNSAVGARAHFIKMFIWEPCRFL